MREEARKIDGAIRFDEQVEQVQDAVALADRFLDQAQAVGLRLRLQLGERPQASLRLVLGVDDTQVAEVQQHVVELRQGGGEAFFECRHEGLCIERLANS